MKIMHTAHRRNSMVGTVEDLPDDEAYQLIRAGFAVEAESAPIAVPAASSTLKTSVAKPVKE